MKILETINIELKNSLIGYLLVIIPPEIYIAAL